MKRRSKIKKFRDLQFKEDKPLDVAPEDAPITASVITPSSEAQADRCNATIEVGGETLRCIIDEKHLVFDGDYRHCATDNDSPLGEVLLEWFDEAPGAKPHQENKPLVDEDSVRDLENRIAYLEDRVRLWETSSNEYKRMFLEAQDVKHRYCQEIESLVADLQEKDKIIESSRERIEYWQNLANEVDERYIASDQKMLLYGNTLSAAISVLYQANAAPTNEEARLITSGVIETMKRALQEPSEEST